MRFAAPAPAHAPRSRWRAVTSVLVAAWAVAGPSLASDTPPAGSGIYTCVDSQGRKLTSDRPIPECNGREQRVLNRDGSLKKLQPPTLTADERAEQEAVERKAALARAAQADAVRRDRNLMIRFPDEAAHRKAREAALDTVRLAQKATELRLKDLAAERKPLRDEAEFFKGRPLPPRLKQQLDANDAAVDAQRAAQQNQEAELVRVNKLYDLELERLRKLWGGAQPGSLGPTAMVEPAPVAASAPRAPASAKP